MTQEYENLSAMVDGEKIDDKQGSFVKSITSDAALSAKWRSYHLTRDLLRNDMSSDVSFDISDSVAKALDNELAMVAPKPSWREMPVVSAVLPIIRQSGQLAMVACVTAMVIFGVQTYNKPEVTDPFKTAPTILGPQGGLAPVSLQSVNNTQQDRMDQLLQQRRQINALIQDHVRQQRLRNLAPEGVSTNVSEVEEEKFDESGNNTQ
ncbi:MAG: sigma-E factor negative regulatory protein RseA [Alphaproteobacteria bacterium]|jgi:sigma-E factor negative regulatory protein RseA